MRVQQDLTRALIDACPEAVMLFDANGVICAANLAAADRYGYAVAELIGLNLLALDDPSNDPTVPELIRRCLDGEAVRCKVNRRHKDGSLFAVEVQVTAVKVGKEVWLAAFECENRGQQDRERKLNLLRAEIAEATSRVTTSELVTAVRHELNQPLAALQLYVESATELAAACYSPTLNDCLRRINDKLQQTAELIRGKLASPAPLAVQRTPVNIHALIREILEYMNGDLQGSDINVTIDFDNESDLLLADRAQLQQVLVQLIRNAIEAVSAVDDRRRSLCIAAESLPQQVRVSISDTGTGIDPAIAQRLFVPLQTTKPARFGLGLTICRQLIEGLGGELGLESSSAQGTKFYFTLPKP